jgi:L-ascorbate metabolism protein UlaG (beta-lactamase superfamily)
MSTKRIFGAIGLLLLTSLLGLFLDALPSLGTAPSPDEEVRHEASPQYGDGMFHNREEMFIDNLGSLLEVAAISPFQAPTSPIAVASLDPTLLGAKKQPGLAFTWLGHSSMLLEIDGERLLLDPVLDHRASPWSWLGPAPWFPSPMPAEGIPNISAVVISHDHYDHLSRETIETLAPKVSVFIVPLGVDAHLMGWGIPKDQLRVLDWWEETQVGNVRVVSTPARHASGRHLLDQNRTLWCSYVFSGPEHRVYFSGDTGWTEDLHVIGQKEGPFDLTLIESGAYGANWPDWHLGPEQAVRAHKALKGDVLVPIHWGRFALAAHGWTEPAERVLRESVRTHANVLIAKPGVRHRAPFTQTVEPWWPNIPWASARNMPIVATVNGDPNARVLPEPTPARPPTRTP